MLNIGVVGYGYWGPNIVRNFNSIDSAKVVSLCDMNETALGKATKAYTGLSTTTCVDDVVSSKAIDAVAIITPVYTHFELAKKALENGKHVFIEKPFTSSAAHRIVIVQLAQSIFFDILLDAAHGTGKEKSVVNHNFQVSFFGKLKQFLRLCGR
ncbi:MAG TPA: Gfo/Idh/MocA family oxidoreductase [Syntrophorhabdaceae bacterium]|nr:Gfo/Idh/MocA family oxidoreductase [Syntrophorhabdaceae bacterium]